MRRPHIAYPIGWIALVCLPPSNAFASDTTEAFLYVAGLGLITCLVFGIVLALIMKFGFKCGNWVWLLIPSVPIGVIGLFVLAQFFAGNHVTDYHAGPDLEFNGSTTVTVSPGYRRQELEHALRLMNDSHFMSELVHYTRKPLSNYVFALDLTVPGKREARHYVSICVQPKVEVNTPEYDGIMYLFTKAVVASDPKPNISNDTNPPALK